MNITDKNLKGVWVADRTNAIGTQVIIREATVGDLVRYHKPDDRIPDGLVPPSFGPTILWVVWAMTLGVALKMMSFYWFFYIVILVFVLDQAGSHDGIVGAWRRIATTRKRQAGVIAIAFTPLVLFVPNLVFLGVMALGAFALFEFDRGRMLHVIEEWKRHPQQAMADKLVMEGKAVAQEGEVKTWRTWHEWFNIARPT